MILHRYWEGDPRSDTCKRHMWSPFKVKDWTYEELPSELQDLLQYAPEGDALRHKSNMVRYWALATFGGMWADMDVFPLNRSFVVRSYPENAWVASFRGSPCGCLMGGDSRIWAAVFEYACSAPIGHAAWDTSGKNILKEFVDSGLIELQSGLLTADTKGAPFRHLWLTANERRQRGRSV